MSNIQIYIRRQEAINPQKVIAVARGEVGNKERPRGSNRQKYGQWYGFNGVAWCAIFVSWVFDRAGMPLPAIQHAKGFAYCPFGVKYFKDHQQWHRTPKAGDIVFFDFGGSITKHVGIVESVNGNGTITTIEGNTGTHNQDNGGAVMRRTRYPQDIVGYARPYSQVKLSLGDRLLRLQPGLMSGSDVKELQSLLVKKGYAIDVDGIFGNQTSKAVFDFQTKNKLTVDGIVGNQTIGELTRKKSVVNHNRKPSDDDITVLAQTVYGEARGESRKGKIAVAWTVVNRVESPISWWGNSVKEVCLHPMQYSCWNKSDPNRAKILKVTRANPNFEEAYQVAKSVLNREVEDYSKGATHYYARNIRRVPLWARGKTPVVRIDNHLFFKGIA